MKTRISERAQTLGFSAVGFCAPEIVERNQAGLRAFLQQDRHGDMAWMAERVHWRTDPKALWPEVRSVVVLAHNYAPDNNPLDLLEDKKRGVISAYARHRDYHDVMKKQMKALARWMAGEFSCGVKVFVDTAPIMEKPLAQAAGLGWQGKHTNLVSREFGNWLFLGEIFTTLDLASDAPEFDHCGICTRCMDACPTRAIVVPYQLDATRCIAYLTIEHKGQIPQEFRKAIGNRVYGCDDCLAVCPWNKFARDSQEAAYHAREDLKNPRLSELLTLDDASFRAMFSGSPVKRIGRDRFVRNVLVAAGNSSDVSLSPQVEALRHDISPLVAEMAAWASDALAAHAS